MKQQDLPTLNRNISFSQLSLFGLGAMVGGGFYVLLGKVDGTAGVYAPFSFLVAGVIALFSALSYAELSSRYPYSAGEAHYVENAYRKPWITKFIGWLVVITGVIASATLVVASAGFLQDMYGLNMLFGAFLVAAGLTAVASIGIRLSMSLIVMITLVEVGALTFILWNTSDVLADAASNWTQYVPPFEVTAIMGALGGAFLAFHMFIGFENMVNVSEEAKRVKDNMPRAILGALVISTILFILIAVSTLNLLSVTEIANSNTPLVTIMSKWGRLTTFGIALISLLAGLNGALVQLIMASRVTYGLARANRAPNWMGDVHAKTRTPLKSTAMMGGVILVLALLLPLVALAKVTSVLILIVFFSVNTALIRIKRHEDTLHNIPDHSRVYPLWIPYMGAGTTGLILVYSAAEFLRIV